jgi:hypothetical protein
MLVVPCSVFARAIAACGFLKKVMCIMSSCACALCACASFAAHCLCDT